MQFHGLGHETRAGGDRYADAVRFSARCSHMDCHPRRSHVWTICVMPLEEWLRGRDSNPGPNGYEKVAGHAGMGGPGLNRALQLR